MGTNRNQVLSSYLNDKHEIWQATLRNAHAMSSAFALTEIGAVLISKSDLGTLGRHEFSPSDPFDYDIEVFLENEEGGTDPQKAARDLNPITLHICCIYLDQLLLKGSSTTLTFVETPHIT